MSSRRGAEERRFREALAETPARQARLLIASRPEAPLVDILLEDELGRLLDGDSHPPDRIESANGVRLWDLAERLATRILDEQAPEWREGETVTGEIFAPLQGEMRVTLRQWKETDR